MRTSDGSPCARASASSTAASSGKSTRSAAASVIEATSVSSTTRVRTEIRPGSSTSVDRVLADLLELVAVRSAEQLEEVPGRLGLLLVDLRDREADVNEDPVAEVDRVVPRQQPDVDGT